MPGTEGVGMLRYFFVLLTVFVLNISHCPDVFSQFDNKGCSEYGTDIRNPETLESTLWTFRSNVWDGYIDFQEGGKYLTHWGWGTWSVNPDGETIHMANDYNNRTYEVAFTDSGFRFQGMRNDGLIITGRLICAKYQGPGPEVPPEVSEAIKNYYKTYYEREADQKELESLYRLFLQGKTTDEILDGLSKTPEYKKKAAKRAAKIKEMEDKHQLTW